MMLSRLKWLLTNLVELNRAPNSEGPLGALPSSPSCQISTGRIPGSFDDHTYNSPTTDLGTDGLFIRDSAGNIIIRQSSYPSVSGSRGDVYKCTRMTDSGHDEVAVKTFRFVNLSVTEVAKINKSINRELKIWGGLKHQYVLPLEGSLEGFDTFRALVSPWMPNGSLNSYLNDVGVSLKKMDRLYLLRQIAEGLKYLHDNNVIHCDLTSSHILIATDGSPRLASFGHSNIIQSDNTFSYCAGEIRWLAPECIILHEEEAIQYVTKSADIYALGCIILEVLYGILPYWWIKSAVHIFSAKACGRGPLQINTSTSIEPHHLDFMQRCWLDMSGNRPSVEEVLSFVSSYIDPLQARLEDLTKYISKTGEHPVAEGGFGYVWKCVYQNDQGQANVAVKSLRVGDKALKRIERELKICASVQHPNVLTTLGYTTGFGPYKAIVSRWADSGNLLTYLEREDARLDLVRRFQILRDIVTGLQYLHTHKIIHGDLTGSNVLIHGDGTACLADFGLSLMYSESINQASWTSTLNGNVRWMAPELLSETEDGSPVRPSESSDIYSYGGIMLCVLAGKIPFYWLRNPAAIIRRVVLGEEHCRSRYRAFSDEYWHFIRTCWSDKPATRPSTDTVFEVIKDDLKSLSSSSANS